MKGDKEFSGLLSGFDDYVSIIPFSSVLMVDMVLEDVTE
jgi:small nuclear ribonucleoprotein (snRNP)-like protein